MRITRSHPHLPQFERGAAIEVTVDGRSVRAHLDETVAAVLLAEGVRVFSHDTDGRPHSLYCGIGVCYECSVTIDGLPNARACVTPVTEGMVIETGARP